MRLFIVFCHLSAAACVGMARPDIVKQSGTEHAIPLVGPGHIPSICISSEDAPVVGIAANALVSDLRSVTRLPIGAVQSKTCSGSTAVLIGTLDHSAIIDRLRASRGLDTSAIVGKSESYLFTIVRNPLPNISEALVIVGSDRRGTAYGVFELSREIGVSPWVWWADVPVQHRPEIFLRRTTVVQGPPSVQYRGIFLNDEDWGLRPWAAHGPDRDIGNIGPHTYEHVFELLLRLRANTLYPAMHPGTTPFNAIPENARLADRYAIVMGSSHSEELLRNNVGEYDETKDGPWDFSTNSARITDYWRERLRTNGHFENLYTVGMRGVHDSPIEGHLSTARQIALLERVLETQRSLLREYVNPNIQQVPQILWLYKEVLDLYRAGMRVPDDVALGWTDDNYGYIRQLPTISEQRRLGGSGVYYHVSYWGSPQDYLWLCTTPPSLIREEMTKAYDHSASRYWILNVGDLKPAELDIEYFLELAWNEPAMALIDQRTYLERWAAEQFPRRYAETVASMMNDYYRLNFIRKPEFMGFNGNGGKIHRTSFNPLAWPARNYGQNGLRTEEWNRLARQAARLSEIIPSAYRDAYFELVEYPIEASVAQNRKFLFTDRTFLHAFEHNERQREAYAKEARAAYNEIQSLTSRYNSIEDGKWEGMMSSAPRDQEVFRMTATATSTDANQPLPCAWERDRSGTPRYPRGTTGFVEQHGVVSINAAHFVHRYNGKESHWRVLHDLGISDGGTVVYGNPGRVANFPGAANAIGKHAPWVEYRFTTTSTGPANLALYLLPTFPVDPDHKLRFAVSIDGHPPGILDAAASGEGDEDVTSKWETNVLRNAAVLDFPANSIRPGNHTIRLIYMDPAVVFEHIVLTFAGAPPAYPVPPETRARGSREMDEP